MIDAAGAAGRKDHGIREYIAAIGFDAEPVGAMDGADTLPHAHNDSGRGTFVQQHRDDQARGDVAEQLPQRFLIPGDMVFFHHRQKIRRRVARQRRLAEMRIGREKPIGRSLQIREIAAPAAGYQDFRAGLGAMFQHQHPPPAPPGGERGHQPGRAGTDDHDVECFGYCSNSATNRGTSAGTAATAEAPDFSNSAWLP